ncbi:MAG: HdeA/HdeB family chaperone [Reyranellaceae bacterium]
MRILALVALAVSIGAAAQAADPNGRFNILGAGSRKCGEYAGATPQQKTYVETWMAGYISALNRLTPDTWHITGETSVDKVNAMIAQYCSENPDIHIGIAIHRVLERLHPNRIRKSPN